MMLNMSCSPSTPEKPIVVSIVDAESHAGPVKTMSASKTNQTLVQEPSPASTYGETAVGDSVPATPQESALGDMVAGARERSAKSLNFTPFVRTGNDRGQESPTATLSSEPYRLTGRRQHTGFEQSPGTVNTAVTHLEKGKGKATLNDNGIFIHDPTVNQGCKAVHVSSVSSPPSLSGLPEIQGIEVLPVKDASFVIKGNNSKDVDPFVSPARDGGALSHDLADTPSRRSARANDQKERAEHETEEHDKGSDLQSPRADRTKEPISAENAQAVLPPSACVFVANLASVRTDEQLERSVLNIFEQFGPVYIKIRRDTRGMPYAFCQYERDEDARRAIMGGRRKLIDGRPCRTEPAKVNRSLYMSRLTGGKIAEPEARRVLQAFGPVECVWWSSKTEREMYQLPEGIWVKFAYFQDCRDAQGAFREDSIYRLEQPPTPPDFSFRAPIKNASPIFRGPWNRGRSDYRNASEAAPRFEFDRRSIFIGNLPEHASKERVIEVFSQYGAIVTVDLVAKPSAHKNTYNTFAFIEYSLEAEATRAIQGHNLQMFDGATIRVERKDTSEPAPRRVLPPAQANVSGHAEESMMEALKDQFRRATLHIENQRHQLLQMAQATGTPLTGHQVLGTVADNLYGSPAPMGGAVPQAYINAQFGSAPQHPGTSAMTVPQTGSFATHNEHDTNSGPPGFSGYYNQGQDHAVATAPVASTSNMYQPYQHYQQPMGQYQYPSYYPPAATYYHYPTNMPTTGGAPAGSNYGNANAQPQGHVHAAVVSSNTNSNGHQGDSTNSQ